MICSLTIDFDDAPDFPGSGAMALGRPVSAYPLIASKSSRLVGRNYVLTGTPAVKAVALQYGAIILDPPAGVKPGETIRQGARAIVEDLKAESQALELLVLLNAAAPTVTGELIDEGIQLLQNRPELDGAASVSPFPRCQPPLARRETPDGLLEPWAPAAAGGEAWFPNWSAQVVRPKAVEAAGEAPFAWLGRAVAPLKQWGGMPADYQWQLPSLEHWLRKNGFTDSAAALERQPQPKLQPAPKRA